MFQGGEIQVLKEMIAIGETVEEAIANACTQLKIESCGENFEIIEMPVKKTLGFFGGSPAKVRVFVEVKPAQVAADYLIEILNQMGYHDTVVDIKEEDNGAMLCISGGEASTMIGYRGETLHALQYLSGLIANQIHNEYYRITINIGDYREKRRETLTALGTKIAYKALKKGRNFSLEPMNSYERRIIHAAVQNVPGVKSWSKGEHMYRHVIIGPEGGERFTHKKRNGYNRKDRNSQPKEHYRNFRNTALNH